MKSNKFILYVPKKEISYLQWIIESYDGMAIMRTIDPEYGKIEILPAHNCENEILSLIQYLQKEEKINVRSEKKF